MSLFNQLYHVLSTVQLGVRSCVYPQVLSQRLFTLLNVSGITSINTKTSTAMHTLGCIRVFWRQALSLWGMWKLCALIHKHFCCADTWSEMLLHRRAPTQHVGPLFVCRLSVCLGMRISHCAATVAWFFLFVCLFFMLLCCVLPIWLKMANSVWVCSFEELCDSDT